MKKYIHLKKELNTIKKEEGKNSTIATSIDKCGNKVSILEPSNKVDDEKVTKENNI